jgi:hypothetical protein
MEPWCTHTTEPHPEPAQKTEPRYQPETPNALAGSVGGNGSKRASLEELMPVTSPARPFNPAAL